MTVDSIVGKEKTMSSIPSNPNLVMPNRAVIVLNQLVDNGRDAWTCTIRQVHKCTHNIHIREYVPNDHGDLGHKGS